MDQPIDFTKYPIRTCQSLHVCDPCGEQITLGQKYHDGGYGRRAHVACVGRDAELLSEVSDLAAVNAHHVEERDQARRERKRLVNRFRATVAWLKARNAETESIYLDAVADNYFRGVQDGREQVLQNRGMKASEGPKHLPSLGPEPSTVAEWVEQTERTGILELPLLLEIAKKSEARWRCFHCDEVFVDQQRAAAHFGNYESAPACKISDEDVRKLEQELARYRNEDSDLDRAYHAMQADHAVALRREEEKGYARGLADWQKVSDEVGKREEQIRELHGQLSCLCAAIESQPIAFENDYLKQERERARKLLEHYDVSEMPKPTIVDAAVNGPGHVIE